MTMQLLAVVFISLLVLLWPAHRAGATEYMVGDDVGYGWDSGNGVNYAAWASEHAFAVGDVLVFQYVSSQHDLLEVTEEVYRACDTSVGGGNGVRVKYNSGNDRVLLTEARGYWFICDYPGHCLGGMKLAVNVSAGAAAGGGSPTSTVNPIPDGSSAAWTTGGGPGWAAACLALFVLALMK